MLEGVVVADFSELLPGPFLTQCLVDLGASVIKVERPGGDNARTSAPGVFAAVNRGKTFRALDLKTTAGLAAARALVATADVLVEGFRPGVMARLGLGPDELCAQFPRLIYLSLSGFGQAGPLAAVAGHDVTYAASSGVLALAGEPGSSPIWGPGVPVADLCAATYGLSALLAALYARQRTNRGAFLDVSIRDCLAHWLNPRLGMFTVDGLDDLPQQRAAALERPAYGVFRCADGPIALAALEDHFWQRLVAALHLDAWAADTYGTLAARTAATSAINSAIGRELQSYTTTEAVSLLAAAGVPTSPMLEPREAVESVRQAYPGKVADDKTAGPLLHFPIEFHQPVPPRTPA